MQRTKIPDMFFGAKRKIFENAHNLRLNTTPAEKKLWTKLNNKQLGVRFKRQHPIDIFIVDFYCHKFKLVIELDGLIHLSKKEEDMGRTTELERWGLTVIRFSNNEVINDIDKVIETIKKFLK